MIKAVLFDLDGTLLDTLGDIEANVNGMLRDNGYPEITTEQTKAYIGDGAKKLVERALPAGTDRVDECYAYFKSRFEKSDNSRTVMFNGEKEALERLRACGLKLGIVTNKPHAATVRLIEKFFPADTFSFVRGDDGSFPCKPDPTRALYAALTLRVAPAECVFAGDGETDVKTALGAGMKGIACLWGYRTKTQLAAAGAHVFAENFGDLEKIIGKFCQIY